MQNWERSEFDEQWKDAFVRAEVAPSPGVWANLDRELTLAESDEDKKRIIFYQRLAAACILFALMASTFGIYHWTQNDQVAENHAVNKFENPTNLNNQPKENVASASRATEKVNASSSLSANKNKEANSQTSSSTSKSNASESHIRNRSDKGVQFSKRAKDEMLITQESHSNDSNQTDRVFDDSQSKISESVTFNTSLPQAGLLPEAKLHGGPTYVEIVRKLPYIPSAFMNESKNEKSHHEKLWASVSAASGMYSESSGTSYNSMAAMKLNAVGSVFQSPSQSAITPSVAGTTPTVGKSFSYGVIGGVRVAERWVLQTGVQYLNQSVGSAGANALSYSVSTGSFVSTNEFISVPLQVGYLLLDRKMGWQLNPGVSTDFFVRNTTGNQQQSISQGSGPDSPYRPVSFAGLVNSEFSYKMGKSYRLSLVPGLRYSFNSILKSQTSGNAIVWDVGFRFRYIFK